MQCCEAKPKMTDETIGALREFWTFQVSNYEKSNRIVNWNGTRK